MRRRSGSGQEAVARQRVLGVFSYVVCKFSVLLVLPGLWVQHRYTGVFLRRIDVWLTSFVASVFLYLLTCKFFFQASLRKVQWSSTSAEHAHRIASTRFHSEPAWFAWLLIVSGCLSSAGQVMTGAISAQWSGELLPLIFLFRVAGIWKYLGFLILIAFFELVQLLGLRAAHALAISREAQRHFTRTPDCS